MQNSPYQPVLLRVLHSVVAILVIAALISGFWVYDSYDGRWGKLGLPSVIEIQGIHGTIALTFFLILPLFAVYCFRLGDRRLIQPSFLQEIKTVGKPIWWVSLQRLINTVMLLAGTLAVVTGRMMKEVWLPSGDLQQPAYYAHLLSWLILFWCVALHILMGVKVGGVPLLLSMVNVTVRQGDRPKAWLQQFKRQPSHRLLQIIEIIVFIGIVFAWIVPLFIPA